MHVMFKTGTTMRKRYHHFEKSSLERTSRLLQAEDCASYLGENLTMLEISRKSI